jgi:hypothetical protein
MKTAGFVSPGRENIKHREGGVANTNNIMDIIHKIEMKQDSIIEMVKEQIPDEFIRKKSIHLRRNG